MSTDSEKLNSGILGNDLEFLKLQYQVLSERRINHNTLLWNVPSVLFVAQTFLWALALDDEKSLFIRLCVSILSIAMTYVSFQLFERHRFMEVIDAEQMYSIEQYIKNRSCEKENFPVIIVHHKLTERSLIGGKYEKISDFVNYHPYYKHHNKKNSLCQKSSAALWKVIFIFTIILSCIILAHNIIQIPDLKTFLNNL